jgi:hypothetical protein
MKKTCLLAFFNDFHEPQLLSYFLSLKEFSMLESSALKALSIFRRCSTVLQLWMTVEWSRLPIS